MIKITITAQTMPDGNTKLLQSLETDGHQSTEEIVIMFAKGKSEFDETLDELLAALTKKTEDGGWEYGQ